jgi:hypothetical protein
MTTTIKVNRAELIRRFNEFKRSPQRGRLFHVSFVKRTTGEIRRMRAQFRGTREHLAHGEQAYVFSEKVLIPVADLAIAQEINAQREAGMTLDQVYSEIGRPFRSIPVEGILSMTINHEKLEVCHE